MTLREKIRTFPTCPGVYVMKDARGAVLYVGKAKRLRARVGSYFQTRRGDRHRIRLMIRRVADIECILTDTEKEALLLEHTLIRRHRPRYNVVFRDDRSFLNIRVTTRHPFPGISFTRKPAKDGASYFGPYTNALACRETIEQITRQFRLRTCSDREFANRARPCLQYELGRCTAPCVGYVTAEDYAAQVANVLDLLRGRGSELVARLTGEMRAAAAAERFEEAARLRDILERIAVTVEPQQVVRHTAIDRDYVGWGMTDERAAVAVLEVRDGRVVARSGTTLTPGGDAPEEHITSFCFQYYQPPRRPPAILCLPWPAERFPDLAAVLSERRGGTVRLLSPRRGPEAKLLRLAATNALAMARSRQTAAASYAALAEQCRRALQLESVPTAIECVDISNWQGDAAVGALVCFIEGEPAKERYRYYTIRTARGPDDYAMMREVLSRRLTGDLPRPDLLLVDGGRGQLQVARRVLDLQGVLDLPLAAIAKPTAEETTDKVYLPDRKNPVKLRIGDPVLLLLQRIRDEAHRFGITLVRKRTAAVAATNH
ncbi:MAG: excinuclease ABC subunit UvrC [Deltaproteobacteria bacterium]|nr:excinuclease ABC subunit UvrC [Deltaproteobacteria bacterium]